jgi:lipopolysaccharide/colanic/teichoic acid biosynthesis glycosyltransferase
MGVAAPPRRRLDLRRTLDLVGASLLLLVAAPLLLLGIAAVWLDSGRPVFFGHVRLGLGGRTFRCWKLRTMTVGAEDRLEKEPRLHERYLRNGCKLPTGDDPRVTRSGRWLRRSYLDEIPQLFNVLEGSMSLVGPRPIGPEERAHYYRGREADELLMARPGIFGAWTSLGHRRPNYPDRARLELEYVRNRSLQQDLAILLRSIPVVLRGEGGR